jgi:hypothetical protein
MRGAFIRRRPGRTGWTFTPETRYNKPNNPEKTQAHPAASAAGRLRGIDSEQKQKDFL